MAYRETTVTEKGQVTIPREIRERLRLRPRDRVIFEVEGDAVRIRRAPSKALALYGAVSPRNRPEDFAALREAFERGVADEVARERSHGA